MSRIKNYFQTKYQNFSKSKPLQIGSAVFVIYVALLAVWFNGQITNAVAIQVNGKEVAVVATEEQANAVLNSVTQALNIKVGQDIELKEEIKYIPVKSENRVSETELENIFSEQLTFTTEAAGIKVNGELKVIVQNEKVANQIIEAVKTVEVNDGQQYEIESVKTEEAVNVVKIETKVDSLVSKDQALAKLKNGEVEKNKVHTVAEGESLWTIADKYKQSVDELIVNNPEIDPGALQIGYELNIVKVEPLINVLITAKAKLIEELAFETTYKEDKSLVSGRQKVQQEGVKGKVENTYTVVLKNNVVVDKELLSAKTLEQPKPKVVAKGTKITVVASRGGSANGSWSGGGGGNFAWPAQGRLTSPFGDGRGHSGIDIANKTGTGIYAAESGVVTFSSYAGGYGNYIDIDHGNGYLTRYAHLSSFAVSVGKRVSRGQLIAYMGNTGRSTGPHLHFEIRTGGKWGTPHNPIKYLR